jgi:acetophenone carboxylase
MVNRSSVCDGKVNVPPFYAFEDYFKMEGDIYLARGNTAATLRKEDDIWVERFQGAGGFGDPLEADPELVVKDVKEGFISDWTAKNVYLVQYDDKTFTVDCAATEKRREDKRKERIKKSMTFDEYLKKIKNIKPAEKLLQTYGNWP